jgi:hypothetical protein
MSEGLLGAFIKRVVEESPLCSRLEEPVLIEMEAKIALTESTTIFLASTVVLSFESCVKQALGCFVMEW